jgi:hypothetical protein
MVDYTVKRYSKELNWAIDGVLVTIDNFDRNYPYYDISRMTSALTRLETLVDSIVVFPGLEIEWSDYHENLEKLILFDSRVSLEKRLKSWYIFKYKGQRTLKFKRDLVNYLEILRSVVNSFVEWSNGGISGEHISNKTIRYSRAFTLCSTK